MRTSHQAKTMSQRKRQTRQRTKAAAAAPQRAGRHRPSRTPPASMSAPKNSSPPIAPGQPRRPASAHLQHLHRGPARPARLAARRGHQNRRDGKHRQLLALHLRAARGRRASKSAWSMPGMSKACPARRPTSATPLWLQQLHAAGLLRGSFRPRKEILPLRYLMRHRQDLIAQAGQQVQLMQKVLTEMNLHIHHVFSDVDGVSAQAIITAILAGERDADKLAEVARPALPQFPGQGQSRAGRRLPRGISFRPAPMPATLAATLRRLARVRPGTGHPHRRPDQHHRRAAARRPGHPAPRAKEHAL